MLHLMVSGPLCSLLGDKREVPFCSMGTADWPVIFELACDEARLVTPLAWLLPSASKVIMSGSVMPTQGVKCMQHANTGGARVLLTAICYMA